MASRKAACRNHKESKTMTQSDNQMQIFIRKCGAHVAVDWNALPDHVKVFVQDYGLRQILNDCHSSEKEPELAMSLVEKKLDALMAGTIKQGRTASDPFSAWLKAKLIDIVSQSKGITKKAAGEALRNQCGSTPQDWINGLYGDESEAALDQFRTAWEKEQAEAKSLVGSLGTISLG